MWIICGSHFPLFPASSRMSPAVMIPLSRRFSTVACPVSFLPRQKFQPRPANFCDPFSEINNQSKLLESSLISTLDECIGIGQVKQVHGHVFRKGLDQSCYVLSKLVRTLTKLGVPMDRYPLRIIEPVQYRNPFLWTAVIRGYAVQGSLAVAVSMYGRMREEGIRPVSFTFSALLKACGLVNDVNLGQQFHAQSIILGQFASDLYVGNTMIDMYVRCGCLDCARKVFDEMPERDLISWTELIVAYARAGDMVSADELFEGLVAKDMVAWTAMVTGFAQNARPWKALEYFRKMQDSGIGIDEVTLVGVISACAQLGATKYGDWVRDIARKSGFDPSHDVVVGSALIDMYSKCGKVDDALKVFESMNAKNVFSYSSMIMGFAMHGRAQAAIDLFHHMVTKTTIKPNDVTFIGVLTACSHTGLVEQGRQIFVSMRETLGIEPTANLSTCMVDLLGRAGRLDEALELIKSMSIEQHGVVWGALLGACKIHNNPDVADIAAQHLFELEPDAIGNYILLSNVYASAGDWDGVMRVRKLIREKGLKKNPASSWVEDNKGQMHEFFASNLTHPMYNEIKETLEKLLERLKAIGYRPDLSSVPYDVNDDEKMRILEMHSEKMALAFSLQTTGGDSSIRIMKNLRICEDCHLFMRLASEVTGREITVRDKMRFHHFRSGACSCGDFW
ncbi:PREDICTED: pentatricopeptide repeat-containing protein At5g44230 [Tarenaya hassleriana]|uniref:pentatricopeptide repeat-containing protein At5g44230 n=1 Tax=Tarenaya hassleriana TaxID=28532 RepID=UPI00053C1A3D|nr:PREDICTED: pentatricopeptide repeat-containing protein At5g44230 [Tarenaya hassleriana]